jgi:hypothetical protein
VELSSQALAPEQNGGGVAGLRDRWFLGLDGRYFRGALAKGALFTCSQTHEEISVQQITCQTLPTDLISVYLALVVVQFHFSHQTIDCSTSSSTGDYKSQSNPPFLSSAE